MTAAHRRGASLELRTARALGSRRVHRARGKSAQDIELVRLPSGAELVCECKHRRRAPALLLNALEQARRYDPEAIPVAVVAEYGGQPIVAISLADFRRLVGLAPADAPEQPSLLARRAV